MDGLKNLETNKDWVLFENHKGIPQKSQIYHAY